MEFWEGPFYSWDSDLSLLGNGVQPVLTILWVAPPCKFLGEVGLSDE